MYWFFILKQNGFRTEGNEPGLWTCFEWRFGFSLGVCGSRVNKLSSILEYFRRLSACGRSIFHGSENNSCRVSFSQGSIWDPRARKFFDKSYANQKLEDETRHKKYVLVQTSSWRSLNAASLCLKSKTHESSLLLKSSSFLWETISLSMSCRHSHLTQVNAFGLYRNSSRSHM